MIAGEASRDVTSNATGSAVVVLLVLTAASALGAWWWTRYRQTERSATAWFAALASVAACVSLTLARDGWPESFRPGEVLAWTTAGWDRLVNEDLIGSSQFVLNIALFVPAGTAWTWATGRAWRSLLGLIALSMVIESGQAVAGLGASDVTDLAANSIGALLGCVLAATVVWGLRRAGHLPSGAPDPRRRAFAVAGCVVLVVGALTALLAGADRHQSRIHQELERAFAGMNFDDIAAVLYSGSEDFDADAPFSDSEQIWSAISVRSDGARYRDDRIELRWPATFFGLRRCVFVIWEADSVEIRDVSGRECTDFIS